MASLDELLADVSDEGSENGAEDGYDYFAEQDGKGAMGAQDGGAADDVMGNTGQQVEGDGDGDVDDESKALNALATTEDDETAEIRKAQIEKMDLGKVEDVNNKLSIYKELAPVIDAIKKYNTMKPGSDGYVGKTADNPEYKLLNTANEMSTRVDSDMIIIHRWLRDHYNARFPELERLVVNPLDYAKVVAVLGNVEFDGDELKKIVDDSNNNIFGKPLGQLLDRATCAAVTMEAVLTTGKQVPDVEIDRIIRACQTMLDLEKAKEQLASFAESRMSKFAPNLSTLLGTKTTTQLINSAGGIDKLAISPACNIPSMGNKKKATAMGMASNVGIRNQGYIYNNDFVQTAPKSFTVQAMRMLSAKIVLAARLDASHSSPSGEAGLTYLEDLEKRLTALSKVPDSAKTKALPAPDDKPARKRGGRRARKAKEATAMTDLRKQQNRMAFGKEEAETGYGTGDSTRGLGMIGKEGETGGIRGNVIDQRTRAKLSKKNPGWGGATPAGGAGSGNATALGRAFGPAGATGSASTLKQQGLRASGTSGLRTAVGAGAGTASTIAFTPGQGMELADPREQALKRKREEESDGGKAGWFKAGISSTVPNTDGKVDAGGFKIPALPSPAAKKPKTEEKK